MNCGLLLLTSCRKYVITNHFIARQNKIKKLLTGADDYDNISELLKTTENIDN